MTRPRRGISTVDVMDYWKPEDDTERDRREGLTHIGPALQRAFGVLYPDGGVVNVPRGTTRLGPGFYNGYGKITIRGTPDD